MIFKRKKTMTPYQENRMRLMDAIKNGIVVIHAGQETTRNSDVHYVFRQDSNFLFLSGITEPDFIILLDATTKQATLFIPNLNLQHQLWVGKQHTTKTAKKEFGFDEVFYRDEFDRVLKKLTKKNKKIYVLPNDQHLINKELRANIAPTNILTNYLNELRVRKTKYEISFMQKANDISQTAHIAAMQYCEVGLYEYHLKNILEKFFFDSGEKHLAYPSIVASGNNAAILHYTSCAQKIKDGDLVLIDAGVEYCGYASDITRTFPANGKFNKQQKDVYELVLKVQEHCIKMIKPHISMLEIHATASKMILAGLIDLGMIYPQNLEELYKKQVHKIFFPHSIGHLLGLDVHDVGAIDSSHQNKKTKKAGIRTQRVLEKDFVVTIEPGIYFIEGHFQNAETRQKYKNEINWEKAEEYKKHIGGIRIEDNVLVTKTGYKNLTHTPKTVGDIEQIMNKRSKN